MTFYDFLMVYGVFAGIPLTLALAIKEDKVKPLLWVLFGIGLGIALFISLVTFIIYLATSN